MGELKLKATSVAVSAQVKENLDLLKGVFGVDSISKVIEHLIARDQELVNDIDILKEKYAIKE